VSAADRTGGDERVVRYPAANGAKGYTLIELSLVILLIGIIIAFALPRLGDLGDSRLKSAARQLAGNIQSTFDEAVYRKQDFDVIYDITQGNYRVIVSPSDEESPVGAEDAVSDEGPKAPVTFKKAALPDKVRFKDISTERVEKATEGQVTAHFFPEGWAEKTLIHLTDDRKEFTLIVMPYTGKVKILEGYVEQSEEGRS
jgi:prepilin-type N-terminal cleavage/methylation domain-containing protein